MRRLVLLALVVAAALWWRRRPAPEHVDVTFDDGSFFRLERGREADDLLDDAYELLRTLAA